MTVAWAGLAADILVILHLVFVAFVLFGAVLVYKWPKLIWLHLPALCWGTLVEFSGWICPLTPLENALRARAGLAMYHGDFVMHYLMPVLYPVDLTRGIQLLFGVIVLGLNLVLYYRVFRRYRRRQPHSR